MKPTHTKKEYDNKKQRVKLMLLNGRKLTPRYLDHVLCVNNSPEIIRQLRAEIPIKTTMVYPKGKPCYGVYSYEPPKVHSRIETREYLKH